MATWTDERILQNQDSITYNEAGITYNEEQVQYNGITRTKWDDESLEASN